MGNYYVNISKEYDLNGAPSSSKVGVSSAPFGLREFLTHIATATENNAYYKIWGSNPLDYKYDTQSVNMNERLDIVVMPNFVHLTSEPLPSEVGDSNLYDSVNIVNHPFRLITKHLNIVNPQSLVVVNGVSYGNGGQLQIVGMFISSNNLEFTTKLSRNNTFIDCVFTSYTGVGSAKGIQFTFDPNSSYSGGSRASVLFLNCLIQSEWVVATMHTTNQSIWFTRSVINLIDTIPSQPYALSIDGCLEPVFADSLLCGFNASKILYKNNAGVTSTVPLSMSNLLPMKTHFNNLTSMGFTRNVMNYLNPENQFVAVFSDRSPRYDYTYDGHLYNVFEGWAYNHSVEVLAGGGRKDGIGPFFFEPITGEKNSYVVYDGTTIYSMADKTTDVFRNKILNVVLDTRVTNMVPKGLSSYYKGSIRYQYGYYIGGDLNNFTTISDGIITTESLNTFDILVAERDVVYEFKMSFKSFGGYIEIPIGSYFFVVKPNEIILDIVVKDLTSGNSVSSVTQFMDYEFDLVAHTNGSLMDIKKIFWDFGDNSFSKEFIPTHFYNTTDEHVHVKCYVSDITDTIYLVEKEVSVFASPVPKTVYVDITAGVVVGVGTEESPFNKIQLLDKLKFTNMTSTYGDTFKLRGYGNFHISELFAAFPTSVSKLFIFDAWDKDLYGPYVIALDNTGSNAPMQFWLKNTTMMNGCIYNIPHQYIHHIGFSDMINMFIVVKGTGCFMDINMRETVTVDDVNEKIIKDYVSNIIGCTIYSSDGFDIL